MNMSGVTETTSSVSQRSTSPRPPAVGEEVKKFHDTSQRIPEPYKNWNMEFQSKTYCGDSADRPVTPTCTENVTESAECTENSPNPSPPASYKWAQSLHCLLEDMQGVSLFEKFLLQEGQDITCLLCLFAYKGFKKNYPSDRESVIKLTKVVFEKKVKRISVISDETKEEIRQKLASNTNVDDTIFDAAQREVESYIMKTTYPNFLRSDLYIQHLGGWQNELSPEKEYVVSPEPLDLLPTVHEDAELHIAANKIPLTKTNLLQRNKISTVSKLKPEGPVGSLRSPYSNYINYHSKYGSVLPASAQDSELQSLSSDAQTDDTMSLTDGSVDYPMYSRSKQKRPQRVSKHNAILNKDRLSHGTFIPRTERLPESMKPQNPAEFYAILVKKLNKVIEDRRMNDKMAEKLKSVESDVSKSDENSFSGARSSHKSNNVNPVFDAGFLSVPFEENDEAILDNHISRVFEDSGQHTPAPGCMSPPTARPSSDAQMISRVPPLRGSGSCEPPDYPVAASHKHSQISRFTVSNSIKHRKDHDTHSTDSAMFDYVSDDNMPSSYRSQYCMGNSELNDYSRRCKEHSKRYASKKFSTITDSSSSCVDSGISLACESVPSYSKVTNWLEKKMTEQEREQCIWRNSSTSPVLSRSSSSRKAVCYNNSRSSSQDVGCSQWPGAPTQLLSQDLVSDCPPPDTTTNLLEAKRRLEDQNRAAKMKLKCASGSRNSHDTSRMKFSKGYDSYDDGLCHRKPNRKSCSINVLESTPMNAASNDVTVIGYSYGRHSVPYLSKLPGRNITLKQFKSLLSKKGNFKYFFKTASNDFGTGVVFEEVTDDCKVLPLWEGKVFCVIESMDDSLVM